MNINDFQKNKGKTMENKTEDSPDEIKRKIKMFDFFSDCVKNLVPLVIITKDKTIGTSIKDSHLLIKKAYGSVIAHEMDDLLK